MNTLAGRSPRLDGIINGIVHYRRLVFSLVFLFIVVGLLALFSMARQEDPLFPYRTGLITVFYPGGTPLQIEKLVTEPLEEELSQVAEIDVVTSTSRDDLAIFQIDLQDYVYATDAAWDRVRRAVERAKLEFPQGVTRIEFDDRKIDMPVAVLSITGSDDPILLENAADKLKRALSGLGGISRIEVKGAPAKEVIVKIDQNTIDRLGISRQRIAQLISERNRIIPGGLVSSSDRNIRINTQSDFASLQELGRTVITLPSGQNVPLESIAEISLEPQLPLTSQAYQDGQRAVSLGIIAQRGQLDVIKFGQQLRERISSYSKTLAPLKIEESFFQPDYVQDRLDGLRGNLIFSVLIIAVLVFFAMGWRTGALVSSVLPVVSIISLGLYSAGGGVFHQMAVIGMVISLGILIDNAIVVVEFIETSVRKGVALEEAFRDAIHAMAKPLFASTGTTVAAFIPLLLAKGGVGDFTRAIPTMIVIALIVSYVISILVLPLIARSLLKHRSTRTAATFALTDRLADWCADKVEAGPKRVLTAVLILLGVSVAMAPLLKQEFFPSTDRAQIVLDMELPNNTPLAVTEKVSREIEQRLSEHEAVRSLYRSVGGAGFRFYYNMGGAPNESHIARLTINTTRSQQNTKLIDWVRQELKPRYPDVVLVPRLLGQGPPRLAPIEVRVKHPDQATLHTAGQMVKRLLLSVEGITELRSNLDIGTPELQLAIHDSASLSYGLQPNDIATAVFSESRGLAAGQYRYDNDPIPIRVRSSAGQRSSVEVLQSQNISSDSRSGAPLHQVASMRTAWTPTYLRHHNYQRTVTVLAQIKQGYAYNGILSKFNKLLAEQDLPPGVVVELGGDAAASSESNSNIATAAPLAIGLLFFFMMYQFNSFRRLGIVMITIPLAAVGVVPGLAISGQPFGFQSLLGVIALIGIVVNNAIVLIDVVDSSLKRGEPIQKAVRAALEQRTAPILLTSATTILGLLPLAFSSSTLWPPMAWAIISGLTLSSMLTLIAVPALCTLMLGRKQGHTARGSDLSPSFGAIAAAAVGVFLVLPSINDAKASTEAPLEINAATVIELAKSGSGVIGARSLAMAASHDSTAQRRKAWAPKINLGGEYGLRDEVNTITLPEPFGDLQISDKDSYVYELKITQPLFDLANQRYKVRASRFAVDQADYRAEAIQHQAIGEALKLLIRFNTLRATRTSIEALKTSLSSRLLRIEENLAAGRVLKTDKLQVQVTLNQIEQQLTENANAQLDLTVALRNSLNIGSERLITLGDIEPFEIKTSETPLEAKKSCFRRSDCLALQTKIEQLGQQAKALRASYLPKVDLSYAERRSNGQLFIAERDRRALLEFSWPLFSGGQRSSERKSVKANQESASYRLAEFQNTVKLQLQRAISAENNARSAIQLAKSSVELDKERLRLSRKRYESGLLNIDELLDSEASLSRSNSELVRAQLALVEARVDLKLATGDEF